MADDGGDPSPAPPPATKYDDFAPGKDTGCKSAGGSQFACLTEGGRAVEESGQQKDQCVFCSWPTDKEKPDLGAPSNLCLSCRYAKELKPKIAMGYQCAAGPIGAERSVTGGNYYGRCSLLPKGPVATPASCSDSGNLCAASKLVNLDASEFASKICRGPTCTPEECCAQACTDTGLLKASGPWVKSGDFETRVCKSAECVLPGECYDRTGRCSDSPEICSSAPGLKKVSEFSSHDCEAKTCTAVECCEKEKKCSDYDADKLCGANMQKRDSFDTTTCESECTEALCCDTKPEPPPVAAVAFCRGSQSSESSFLSLASRAVVLTQTQPELLPPYVHENEAGDLDLLDPDVFDKALAGPGKAGQGTGCTGASSSMDACHEKGEYAVMSSHKGIDQCVYCTWPKKKFPPPRATKLCLTCRISRKVKDKLKEGFQCKVGPRGAVRKVTMDSVADMCASLPMKEDATVENEPSPSDPSPSPPPVDDPSPSPPPEVADDGGGGGGDPSPASPQA